MWEISAGVPVRCMGLKQPLAGVKAVAFSRDGRLLFFTDGRRLVGFDPDTGRELTQVEFGEAHWLGSDAHHQLWASSPIWGTGRATVRCWSLHPGAAPGEWTLSSPKPALEADTQGELALSGDGGLLAVAYGDRCRIIETGTGREVARTPGQVRANHYAFSPDNRWLAGGGFRYGPVHLWELISGQTNLLKGTILQEESSGGGVPRFSPAGNWLAVHWGVHLAMYDTAQWARLWTHPVEDGAIFTFAPDGQLLALRTDKHHIHLLAPKDGAVLATLEMPGSMPVQALAFSPDSALLAVANSSTRELFVWNLPAVRRELARLGLDWEAPSDPKSTAAGDSEHR